MGTIQGFTPTVDGNDEKLTLHYFGRMAFVKTFLPQLRSAGPDARVISVLSGGVHNAYAEYTEDFELKAGNYSIRNAADAAGFYTDLGLDAFASKEVGVTFVHAAPGFVNTNWGTEMPWYIKGLVRLIQPVFGKSPGDCAECMLAAVFLSREELGLGADNRVVVLDEHGAASADGGKLTKLHGESARGYVWDQTEKVLKRARV